MKMRDIALVPVLFLQEEKGFPHGLKDLPNILPMNSRRNHKDPELWSGGWWHLL